MKRPPSRGALARAGRPAPSSATTARVKRGRAIGDMAASHCAGPGEHDLPSPVRSRPASRVVPALLLAAAVLAVFWPALGHDFVNYDDDLYVTRNAWVQQGLTWASARWALTTDAAGNWHPLTWLSHQL